ncbi:MAG TPA: hypothetical protein VIW45_01105 [Vicinamibacterales bacterium]|jgi:hypothetical protein
MSDLSSAVPDDAFDRWLAALEARHLANLTFSEVTRALRALSSAYVERRGPRALGAALAGEGKRAAFALFYGPLHFLLTREIVRAVRPRDVSTIVDLGCGTGAAGAAWASAFARRDAAHTPSILGIDKHPWAQTEAAATYRAFGLDASVRRGDVTSDVKTKGTTGIVAAFTVNELADDARAALLTRLVEHARRGHCVLVVEPLARSIAPWWNQWREAFASAGGRADEWRFRVDLPPLVAKLDRAAGLDHRELTGRSIMTP